jgi:photosystem II stability/assembly factor-like uncharacterized protein
MKLKIITILLFYLFLIPFNSFAQTGWFHQAPYPTTEYLYSVKLINNLTGFTVGTYGAILKTTNGGINWHTNSVNTNRFFYNIYFINAITGFVVGDSSAIYKSTNAGDNWFSVFNSNSAYPFKKIYFINENTGYTYRQQDSKLFKTTDNGNNWINIQTNIPNINSNRYYFGFLFKNENTGYYCGDILGIYKTTDGGYNWNVSSFLSPNIYSLCFINENTGFGVGYNGAYAKTTNDGLNWVLQDTIYPHYDNLIDIKFLDSINGFIFMQNAGVMFRTTNQGLNWTLQQGSLFMGLYGFDFSDLNTGYIVGTAGIILKTTNSGTNWQFVSSGNYFNNLISISFINQNNGCTVGSDGILWTTNGGEMWQLPMSLNSDYFLSVQYLDTTSILAASYNRIHKSTDKGLNWVINASFPYFSCMHFINNMTGFVDAEGGIIKTTNAGENWTYIHSDTTLGFSRLFFLNEFTGFGTGLEFYSKIYKTINGGINWNIVFDGNSNIMDINSLNFTDSLHGFASTYNSLLMTTNGGNNWSYKLIQEYYGLISSYFVNKNTGFMTGYSGTLIKTTNCGDNWIMQNSGILNEDLNNIFFLDSNIGWVIGNHGIILKTTDGGSSVWIKNNIEDVPQNYFLYQNYPNPFNPTTNIKYAIPKDGFVTIKIYDLLGREINKIVSETQKAGFYTVQFNGASLSSGVYFYRIKSGSFVQTKKMVLIK